MIFLVPLDGTQGVVQSCYSNGKDNIIDCKAEGWFLFFNICIVHLYMQQNVSVYKYRPL